MKRKNLIKSFVMSLACLFITGYSFAQTWTTFDGASKMTDANSTGLTLTAGNNAGTGLTVNQVLTKPNGNKTLNWEATTANRNSINSPATTLISDLSGTATVLFRVKNTNTAGTLKTDQGFELEFYTYNTTTTKAYKFCFYQGCNDSIYLDNATTATAAKRLYYSKANQINWHTYRMTITQVATGAQCTLYVDENTTPLGTFLSTITTTNKQYIKTGVPNLTWITTMKTEIDWFAWDVTGAYTPGTGTLPAKVFVDGVNTASDKAITSFKFTTLNSTGVIDETNKAIAITVPKYAVITSLTPTIVTSPGSYVNPVTAKDFTNPITYTVAAEDNSTQAYVATVSRALLNDQKDITAFNIPNQLSSVINATAHTVTITMPYLNVNTALVPSITPSLEATIAPITGVAQDFTNPVTYTVTAGNGNTQAWTVTVTNNTPNDIKTFNFAGLTPVVVGVPNDTTKVVNVTVPFGTNVTALLPTITLSDNATVVPLSGVAQNFTDTVIYSVTTGDGLSVKKWKVKVKITPVATDNTLQDLKVNGITIPYFNAATLSYIYRVDSGSTIIPTITATKNNVFAALPKVTAATVIPGSTTILVKAQDSTAKTYTVQIQYFQKWVKYDCSVRLDSVSGNPFTVSNSAGVAPTLATVNDPEIPGNKLMSFQSGPADQNLLTINPWAQLKDSSQITIIMRVKAKDTTYDKVSDVDIYWGQYYREKWFMQRPIGSTSSVPLSIKAEKRAIVDNVSDINNWHIYRVVIDTTKGARLYIDEKLTTVTGGFAKPLNLGITSQIWRLALGDGSGSTGYSCYYDYVTWTKGAFAPGEGPAIPAEFNTTFWGDSLLSDLKVAGATVTGFNPSTLTYNVQLAGTAVPAVTAITHNPKAKTVITSPTALPGIAKIIVTAQDGRSKATYKIVYTSTDASIASLIGLTYGNTDVPNFAPDTLKYYIELAPLTSVVPLTTYAKGSTASTVVVTDAASLPGKTTIVATSGNGAATKTYEINFTVKKSPDATLSKIISGIFDITGFKADSLTYSIILNADTKVAPSVVATPTSYKSTVVVTYPTKLPGKTVIAVIAEDTAFKKTYEVNYTVKISSNAKLAGIKYDTTHVTGFIADTLSYKVELPVGMKTVPVITVATISDSATVVIAPATKLPGKTLIKVTAQDDTTIVTYAVNFTVKKSTDATLSSIKYGSTSITGFAAATLSYSVILPAGTTAVPVITVTTTNDSADVTIVPATAIPGKTSIKVTAEDGTSTKTYEINFTLAVSVNTVEINSISCYPNPVTDHLNIKLTNILQNVKVSLFNILGEKVLTSTFSGTEHSLDISGLQKGLYLLKLNIDGKQYIQKIEVIK